MENAQTTKRNAETPMEFNVLNFEQNANRKTIKLTSFQFILAAQINKFYKTL